MWICSGLCSSMSVVYLLMQQPQDNFSVQLRQRHNFCSGYKPPTPYQLGKPSLKEAVNSTSNMRKDHERAWKHYGCTLMSDGWSDRKGCHLINFLVTRRELTSWSLSMHQVKYMMQTCLLIC